MVNHEVTKGVSFQVAGIWSKAKGYRLKARRLES